MYPYVRWTQSLPIPWKNSVKSHKWDKRIVALILNNRNSLKRMFTISTVVHSTDVKWMTKYNVISVWILLAIFNINVHGYPTVSHLKIHFRNNHLRNFRFILLRSTAKLCLLNMWYFSITAQKYWKIWFKINTTTPNICAVIKNTIF